MESEEGFSFPPSERKVITQPIDLSIQTLVDQWKANIIILPEIQREYLWDNGKASRLIESLLLNIPIPVLYFAETQEAKYEIIDGHQRVRSIARFFSNEFALSGLAVLKDNYGGLRHHKLSDRDQRFLKMRTLRAIIISVDSHPTMKFEIFERLNTGSISLNAQELRNSLYRGNFNKLLRKLALNEAFRSILGSRQPRKRMVDEELVLRFFALRDTLNTYRPPLKRALNDYMDVKKAIDEATLAQYENEFISAINRVKSLIGDNAFRLTDQDGKPLESAVNRALFDAQMLTASWTNENGTPRGKVLGQLAALNTNSEFLDSIQRATGDRSRTLKRVRDTVDAFKRAGLTVNVPYDLSK